MPDNDKILKPWKPVEYEPAEALALQALEHGTATPYQQKLALDWIIKKAAMNYEVAYIPDSERDTSFALGRQFVGRQIVKLLTMGKDQLGFRGDTEQP